MELFNFNTAYTQLRELYGIELTPDQFESMGMIAWTKIGNKLVSLNDELFDVDENGIVTLPCEADSIEAIYIGTPDYQATSNKQSNNLVYNQHVEQYINARRGQNTNLLYRDGKLIKYRVVDHNKIQVPLDNGQVRVLYKTVQYDENGLPLLNLKEIDAIAAYCAYAINFKKSLMTKDQATFQLAQSLKQEWMKLCDHARTPINMSQNDFDAIGDVRYSWDRKSYGKTFKPVK